MVLPSPFSPTNQNNLSVNSIRATLGEIQPVQRHLKFSHVVGQVSAKSSNTTRPTTENMQSAYKLMTYCFVQQLPGVPLMDMSKKHLGREGIARNRQPWEGTKWKSKGSRMRIDYIYGSIYSEDGDL